MILRPQYAKQLERINTTSTVISLTNLAERRRHSSRRARQRHSGISGAAMLVPVFLIGFPLFDVPRLTTVEAIGTSLFLETSGFGTGL